MQKMMMFIIIIASFIVFGLAIFLVLGKGKELAVAIINPLGNILKFFMGSGKSIVS